MTLGKVNILSCKYHGWSYGLNGKLAKAPYFDKFADFVKENNGMLPIHVHIDAQGFIWVNLDASEVPAMQWDKNFNGVDAQPRMAGFDFSQYRYDHSWAMDGDCNWKVLADNYNECLHCKTAHPDTAKVVNIEIYRVEGKDGALLHHNKRQETGANDGKLQLFSTYYFPNACMTVSEPDYFYMMRCVPVSPNKCSMEYEVYRYQNATEEDFNNVDAIFKRILNEDKWLCNNTQKNMESTVYVNGQMHSTFEQGPLYFQKLVK